MQKHQILIFNLTNLFDSFHSSRQVITSGIVNIFASLILSQCIMGLFCLWYHWSNLALVDSYMFTYVKKHKQWLSKGWLAVQLIY